MAPYSLVGDRWKPGLIEICPHSIFNNSKCHIVAKDWRERKFGPDFELRVLGCKAHDIFFTVYPPGWGPYLRSQIIELAPDGGVVHSDGEEEVEKEINEQCEPVNIGENPSDAGVEAPQSRVPVQFPLFRSAIDLAAGIQWPTDRETAYAFKVSDTPGVYRTQLRYIDKMSHFFGIAPGVDDDYQLTAALTLNIPAQEIIDSAVRARDGPSVKGVATEISRFLDKVKTNLHHILTQGANANFWGTPVIVN